MVKREWTGPPLDLTDQHFKERPMSGTPTRDDDAAETIDGTTDDDLFNESTDNIPSYLNRESTPDEILNLIGWAVSVSYRYAVNQPGVEFDEVEVRHILEDYLAPEHFQKIKKIETAPVIPASELPEKQQKAAEAFKSHPAFPDITPKKLAEGREFSTNTARRAIHTMYPGLRGFDDLNESTKVAIQVWAYEGQDASQTELKEKWDIPMRPLGDASRVYPDLVEDQQPIEESTVEAAVERYRENYARPKSESSAESSTGGSGSQKTRDEMEYPDDFTECYRWFIETIAHNPSESKAGIAERIPDDKTWGGQNYYNVVRDHSGTVKARIEEVGAVDSPEEVADYILKETADLGEWNLGGSDGLTELEQEIDAEEVAEIEAEPEAEIETEPEIDFNATERFGFDIEEEIDAELDVSRLSSTRVLLRAELVEGVKDHLTESDEYKSMTELVNSAVKKELNGGFVSDSETTVEADVIETVIESLYGERKANAIRTLLADE